MIVTVLSHEVGKSEAGSQPLASKVAVPGTRLRSRTVKVSLASISASLMIGIVMVRVVIGLSTVAAGRVSVPDTAV